MPLEIKKPVAATVPNMIAWMEALDRKLAATGFDEVERLAISQCMMETEVPQLAAAPQVQAPANEDVKDAARYRWWCDTGNNILSVHTIGGKPTIDAAIDARMQSQPQQVTK